MGKSKETKKAVKLFVLWCMSFVGLHALSVFRRVRNAFSYIEQTRTLQPDGFFWFVFLITAFYSVPLLILDYRYAKMERIRWLTFTTKALLIYHFAVLSFALIISVGIFLA